MVLIGRCGTQKFASSAYSCQREMMTKLSRADSGSCRYRNVIHLSQYKNLSVNYIIALRTPILLASATDWLLRVQRCKGH